MLEIQFIQLTGQTIPFFKQIVKSDLPLFKRCLITIYGTNEIHLIYKDLSPNPRRGYKNLSYAKNLYNDIAHI